MAMKENTKAIMKFLQENADKAFTTKAIAEAVGLNPRQVTGSVNSFVAHKEEVDGEKVNVPLAVREKDEEGTSFISLTEAGKAFDIEA